MSRALMNALLALLAVLSVTSTCYADSTEAPETEAAAVVRNGCGCDEAQPTCAPAHAEIVALPPPLTIAYKDPCHPCCANCMTYSNLHVDNEDNCCKPAAVIKTHHFVKEVNYKCCTGPCGDVTCEPCCTKIACNPEANRGAVSVWPDGARYCHGCCEPGCCHHHDNCCHHEPCCCHHEPCCCHHEPCCCHHEPCCCHHDNFGHGGNGYEGYGNHGDWGHEGYGNHGDWGHEACCHEDECCHRDPCCHREPCCGHHELYCCEDNGYHGRHNYDDYEDGRHYGGNHHHCCCEHNTCCEKCIITHALADNCGTHYCVTSCVKDPCGNRCVETHHCYAPNPCPCQCKDNMSTECCITHFIVEPP
ncbi:hypothetical protein GGI22_002372, partial [Coemansia erecta]